MKLLRALALLSLSLVSLWTHSEERLVDNQSAITFITKQMNVPLEGRFRQFAAHINFDPRNPEASKVEIEVDVASATLGMPDTDAELVKPEWFDAKRFPKAVFKATTVKRTGPGKFEAVGKLEIKSVSRDVIVPINVSQTGTTTVATGTFSLKRIDFKIGDGDWKDTSIVADPVQVSFKLNFTGVGPL